MKSALRPKASIAVALVLVSGGCSAVRDVVVVKDPPAKVSMKGYPIDLAYGEEPAPPEVAPELVPLPPPLAEIAIDIFDLPLPQDDGSAAPPPRPIAPPPDPCPEPGPNTVAEEPITADVKTDVLAGSYLFKQAGTLEIVGLGKLPLPPLTARVVRNVRKTTTPQGVTQTDFEVELFTGLRRQVQRFRVIPNDGIYLTGIQTRATDQTREFNPLLPVLVFELPATQLTSVNGAGVDPLTGETLVVQGTIDKIVRVEGCDEVIDGWHTNATWTFQRGADSQVYQLEYVVATQHGGLFIQDHLKTTERLGPLTANVDVTSTIGSIHPKAAS